MNHCSVAFIFEFQFQTTRKTKPKSSINCAWFFASFFFFFSFRVQTIISFRILDGKVFEQHTNDAHYFQLWTISCTYFRWLSFFFCKLVQFELSLLWVWCNQSQQKNIFDPFLLSFHISIVYHFTSIALLIPPFPSFGSISENWYTTGLFLFPIYPMLLLLHYQNAIYAEFPIVLYSLTICNIESKLCTVNVFSIRLVSLAFFHSYSLSLARCLFSALLSCKWNCSTWICWDDSD